MEGVDVDACLIELGSEDLIVFRERIFVIKELAVEFKALFGNLKDLFVFQVFGLRSVTRR
jgi:hypothetical protein